MRSLIVWLFGLALGGATATATLYFDPLTAIGTDRVERGVASEVLRYESTGPNVLAYTHGVPFGLDTHSANASILFESALAKAALAVYVLTDESGEARALASRVGKLSSLTNPVTEGIIVADNWLVTVPGTGTYFIDSTSNVWPLLRDSLVDVGLFKRPWTSPHVYRLTTGPDIGKVGVVMGVSGIYRNATGVATDTLEVDAITRVEQLPESIIGTLRIELATQDALSEANRTLTAGSDSP